MSKLTASLTLDSLTRPIVEKIVSVDGVDMEIEIATSIDKNSKKMLNSQFDMGEMSFATFIKARIEGFPLIALPLFTGRRFPHASIWCGRNKDIGTLSDLKGKRVGVPQYWMTSSIWHRGLLQEYYGVSPEEINWVTVADERLESLHFPKNVNVERLTSVGGLPALLNDGRVDCLMLPKNLKETFDWVRPFQDLADAEQQYYLASNVFPVMHLIVVSEKSLSNEPELFDKIVTAFYRAKDRAQLSKPIPSLSDEETKNIFGKDPWPYGLENNIASVSKFLSYAYTQGLTDRKVEPDELFYATTTKIQ